MARILWVLYWVGAVAATSIGIYQVFDYGIDNMTGGFMIHTALVLQCVLGLMLLTVQAPTALGEERVRGSLDVLMAAPISTREIIWGKWMGTYRVVLKLAVLPGLAAAVIAATSPDVPPRFKAVLSRIPIGPLGPADRVLAPVLIVAEILSWGAAFTSLGLLLATWTPRISRSIGISLAVFLLLSFGWLFLAASVILPALRVWLFGYFDLEWRRPVLDRPGPDGPQPRGRAHHDHPGAGHRLRRPLAVLGHHGLLVPAGLGLRRVDVLGSSAVVRPPPGPDARDQPGHRGNRADSRYPGWRVVTDEERRRRGHHGSNREVPRVSPAKSDPEQSIGEAVRATPNKSTGLESDTRTRCDQHTKINRL